MTCSHPGSLAMPDVYLICRTIRFLPVGFAHEDVMTMNLHDSGF